MILKNLKSPSENFEMFVKILRNLASICGLDLLEPNFRFSWITYLLVTSSASYYVFVTLTIYNNYKNDWTIILRGTVTFGTACQGVSKIISFVKDRSIIMELYLELSAIYRDYEKKGLKYRKALEASLEKSKQGLIALMILDIIGYVGMVAVPYIMLLWTGERFLVIEFHIPGLDINTDYGYFSTLVFQSILIICCGFGLYCGDLLALIYLLQSFTFSFIFAAKIEYFNEMLENKQNCDKDKITEAVKDLAAWHQKYSNYTCRCNDLYYYIIMVQLVTGFVSCILSTYLIMNGGWPGSYTYLILAFSGLYLYCILGTENERANDKFVVDIYDIQWYKLTVPQQKMVLQVLCMTQSPKTIQVAGIMPLSVSTALQLTKTMYSIFMFMLEFLKE